MIIFPSLKPASIFKKRGLRFVINELNIPSDNLGVGIGYSTYSTTLGKYIISSNTGQSYVLSSTDGTSWTAHSIPETNPPLTWDNLGGNNLIALGSSQKATFWTSYDLENWTSVSSIQPPRPYSLSGYNARFYWVRTPNYIGFRTSDSFVNTGSNIMPQSTNPQNRGHAHGDAVFDIFWISAGSIVTWNGFNRGIYQRGISNTLYSSCSTQSSIFTFGYNNTYGLIWPKGTDYRSTATEITMPRVKSSSIASSIENYAFVFDKNSDIFDVTSDGVTWHTGQLPSASNWVTATSNGNATILFSSDSNTAYKITIA